MPSLHPVNNPLPTSKAPAPTASSAETENAVRGGPVVAPMPRMRTLLATPLAAVIALAVHWMVSKEEPAADTRSYTVFLGLVFAVSLIAAAVQPLWPALRRQMAHLCPILAAAVLLLCLWEVITTGLRLLPLSYFPWPAAILQYLLGDW